MNKITPSRSTCAVSVVIPMYNAEKYIAECLESVLAQTLQDFEVILVNDCSTDNCRRIAESYIEKFGGRLEIYDNEKNSRAAATRNNGLRLACGEYVFFLDADDMILSHGLAEAYKVAKYFNVDVVNITGFYDMSEDGQDRIPRHSNKPSPKGEPILENNLEWRIKGLLGNNFLWAPWRKLSRREFLIENELFFPDKVKRTEDVIWTHGLFFHAKKILHTPITFYLYRKAKNSVTTSKRTPLQNINSRVDNVIHALKWIDDMMNKCSFFDENPQYRFPMLNHIAERFLSRIFHSSKSVSPSDMYQSIKDEFGENFGEYDVAIAVFFNVMCSYQKIIEENNMKIAALEKR